jgi:hypothetical protein
MIKSHLKDVINLKEWIAMQKVNVVATASIVLGDLPEKSQKACSLDYYLIQNECFMEDAEVSPVYGVRVDFLEAGHLVNSAEISDVTASIESGKYLINLLSKNTVTPTSLIDVIEDYLVSEYDTKFQMDVVETA